MKNQQLTEQNQVKKFVQTRIFEENQAMSQFEPIKNKGFFNKVDEGHVFEVREDIKSQSSMLDSLLKS